MVWKVRWLRSRDSAARQGSRGCYPPGAGVDAEGRGGPRTAARHIPGKAAVQPTDWQPTPRRPYPRPLRPPLYTPGIIL